MAATGIKFDDGSGGFASNCFPVRGYNNRIDEASGAWLVAQKVEQRRRFKAVLCAKPRDFEAIRDERKRAEKESRPIVPPAVNVDEDEDDDGKILDGFFLMKHGCVDDPSDLCSINISAQGFTDVKHEDLKLFDNVAYINAAENYLPFDTYNHFPILRELEAPVNALRGLKVGLGDFESLEMLDLSYNNLSSKDLLALGLLPNLTVLHLTGNGLRSVPPDMGRPYDTNPEIIGALKVPRYPRLEILLLDDNRLSELATFASLAALPALRHLNLSQNEIYSVPQLLLVEGQHVEDPSRMSKARSRLSKSSTSSKTRLKSRESRESMGRFSSLIKQREFNQQQPTPRSKSIAMNLAEDAIARAMRSLETSKPNTPAAPPPAPSTDQRSLHPESIIEESSRLGVQDSSNLTFFETSEFAELDLDELDDKVAETMKHEGIAKALDEKERRASAPTGDTRGLPPPPFPKLHYLNLSNNQIEEEEDLLAVAAWPSLAELVIHDNPLTTEHSGDPNLLRTFLHKRLGIHLQRTKPPPLSKPKVEIIYKKERLVKSDIPKVPKIDVDAMLALEAPPSPASPMLKSQPPLPPIPSVSREGTPHEAKKEETAAAEEQAGETFFMTETEEPNRRPFPTPPPGPPPEESKVRRTRLQVMDADTGDRFQGYEDLLNIDFDNDEYWKDMPAASACSAFKGRSYKPSRDIQANVHALKYLLQHPIMFRENEVHLERVQKPFQPHVKKEPRKSDPPKSRIQKVSEMLDTVTRQDPLDDVPLNDVLTAREPSAADRHRVKAAKAEAKKLIGNVQRKYNIAKEVSPRGTVRKQATIKGSCCSEADKPPASKS